MKALSPEFYSFDDRNKTYLLHLWRIMLQLNMAEKWVKVEGLIK